MKEIIFITPYLSEKIWGGKKLKELYNFEIPSNKTGEAWLISAHENGMSFVENGSFKGISLKDLFDNHKELFGNVEFDRYPLLTKIIDANDDLSVQVHPDDEYGLKHENDLGKTECWYILDSEPNTELIYGHNAKTKEDFEKLVKSNSWTDLISKQKIKKGDFFFVPSGTIHAICSGSLVFELQQNSDTTYRLYDFDRLENGEPRELHIEKSIDVTTIPHKVANQNSDVSKNILTKNNYFTLYHYKNNGTQQYSFDNPKWIQVSVIDGTGTIDGTKIKKGQSFILPYGYNSFEIEGSVEIMVSHI